MNTFEDRKKSFEKKFAHDEELQFKINAKKNKYIAEWVSSILEFKEEQKNQYIQEVIKADFTNSPFIILLDFSFSRVSKIALKFLINLSLGNDFLPILTPIFPSLSFLISA